MNLFSKYRISTIDGKTFTIELSELSFSLELSDGDRMYDYEKKSTLALKEALQKKDIKTKVDIYFIIELAADLWIARTRFLKSQSVKKD